MGKKCGHRNVTGAILVAMTYSCGVDRFVKECAARICQDCGAWLSLGPANDTPDALVELRAAEIAARFAELDTERGWAFYLHRDGAEHAGWIEHAFDSAKVPEQDGEWAGYLARCIATHNAEGVV